MTKNNSLTEKPYVLILAGGSGTRLWPLSRLDKPKQLLKIASKYSLIEETIQRALVCTSLEHVIIGTNIYIKNIIQEELSFLKDENFLIEPEGKNTAPIISLFCHQLKRKNVCLSTPIIVLSADQYISDKEGFKRTITEALKLASSSIVCLGVRPTYPDTGYGYIHLGAPIADVHGGFRVHSFLEKPKVELAEKYIQSDKYLWNAGIFIFSIGIFLEELYKYAITIFDYTKKSIEDTKNIAQYFSLIPDISVDYALLEKTKCISIVQASFHWDDIGSFLSLSRVLSSDENNQVLTHGTDVISLSSSNNILHASTSRVVLLGIHDLIVVENNGVLLIAQKNAIGDIKKIRNKLGKDFF